ncbi:hypothetical protein EST38_g10609 [Candolleomyces aberdarensis]|uniref:Nephrocystin 3-like N-terminal domain-containing protein n=1 Tax=Candolleomyces aberdarensis TaxID=2316362 RepID=A0A4Q2D971_9AGAR|nr:hypothetical protein EST38_g10609 [Candolleomyces aberdarensis]
MQMQRLVYGPLKAAATRGPIAALAGHPFLIVIDGLDECEQKDEVADLIDGMLAFFDENPFIPLRVFITSRVEQHIQSRLDVPGVRLDNLVDHCSEDDITTFLEVLFQDATRRNRVIQAYVREHGEWPAPSEKQKLAKHIGGSFIFASAVFKFIMDPIAEDNHPTTPMSRLPLALKMNPGLDGLYAQALARSEHLAHFLDIISTIALLWAPLPTSGIAELLGVQTYDVVNVLSLNNLGNTLLVHYKCTGTTADLEEAIHLFQMHFDVTGQQEDLAHIEMLNEEANRLARRRFLGIEGTVSREGADTGVRSNLG